MSAQILINKGLKFSTTENLANLIGTLGAVLIFKRCNIPVTVIYEEAIIRKESCFT